MNRTLTSETSATTTAPVLIVGDVHGHLDVLLRVLRDAELIDHAARWTGGAATLWFTGDFFDRGTQGLAAVDLVMRLQGEAAAAGGSVQALLGNHDVLILAARRFGTEDGGEWGEQFVSDWLLNGGWLPDLHGLTAMHVQWLTQLPALAKVGRVLLAHADATFYLQYGKNIAEVNQGIRRVLENEDGPWWERLLGQFCQRRAFLEADVDGDGTARAKQFLQTFGAERLVHGHTPIPLITGRAAAEVTAPYVYADGLCINVDGGLFVGSPGFVYELPAEWLA